MYSLQQSSDAIQRTEIYSLQQSSESLIATVQRTEMYSLQQSSDAVQKTEIYSLQQSSMALSATQHCIAVASTKQTLISMVSRIQPNQHNQRSHPSSWAHVERSEVCFYPESSLKLATCVILDHHITSGKSKYPAPSEARLESLDCLALRGPMPNATTSC